jgi:hypothetical protein
MRPEMKMGSAARSARATAVALLAGAAFLAVAAPGTAQGLAARVAAAPADATVRFTFAAKEGVCGNGESISMVRDGEIVVSHGRSWRLENGRYVSQDGVCEEGPVRIDLTKSGGAITGARVAVGGGVQPIDVDLGRIDAAAAVEFLLADNTLHGSARRPAERLVFAATLADAESWPSLLRVARNQRLGDEARKSAIFWLSQVAGERATEGLTSVIGNDSDEMEIRKQAIFALSQVKGDASIDALIDVARSSREPEIRKQAIFWLGQSKDPRVLTFFEEIIRG